MNTATRSLAYSLLTHAPGWLLLLGAGILSLPVAATFLDGQGSENWILPVQVVGMAVAGALIGVGFPGFMSGPARRRALLGAASGVAAAVTGVAVFFVLLSGLRGA